MISSLSIVIFISVSVSEESKENLSGLASLVRRSNTEEETKVTRNNTEGIRAALPIFSKCCNTQVTVQRAAATFQIRF